MANNVVLRKYQYNKPETWVEHLDNFENHCDSRGTLTDDQKRGLLLETLDDTTKRNLKEWFNVTSLRTKTYEAIKEKLNEKIAPAVNRIVRWAEFKGRTQKLGEPAADFMAELKRLATFCDFGGLQPKLIMYQFASGVRDEALQAKLIREHATLTATKALEIAESLEQSVVNVKAIRGQGVEEVHRAAVSKEGRSSQGAEKTTTRLRCYRCGDKGHNAKACPKPWKEFKCTKCGKNFHLAKACKAKNVQLPGNASAAPSSGQGDTDTTSAHYLAVANHQQQEDLDSDSEAEGLYHLHCSQETEPTSDEVVIRSTMVEVVINGFPLQFEVDSGASRTLISYPTFKLLFPGDPPPLYESRVKLVTWGSSSSINTVGRFFANVSYRGNSKYLPVLVGESPGPNLLGRNWFTPFGIGISLEGVHHVPDVAVPREDLRLDVDIEVAVQSFPAVSGEGTGCYRGPPVHLEVDPNVPPKYQRARRVPFALTTRMDEAIDANVKKGIWVPMKYSGPWASAIVPVLKKSGKLRLCADYSGTVNRAISSDTYRTATREEVCARLAGGKVYAELDLEEAYQQIRCDEASSRILCVNTVKGLFKVVCLPFGIKLGPPIFQRVIDGLVGGLRGVVSYQDNIYIAAEDHIQLRERLFRVLKVLGDAGLKVNAKKCVWQAESLNVLGFRMDAEGIHPLEERVAAIKQAPSPTCKQELQSLLGLIGFYDCFFQNKSTILEPLHRLLDANARWKWTDEHQRALQLVKDVISGDQVLTHYTLKAPILLTCDASPVGLGAVISHVLPTDETRTGSVVKIEKPIAFGSRTLTKTERRYAQIEREALAIKFGVKKFSQYLSGRSFTIVTDHKPLLGIFKPGKALSDQLSPRLLRFALGLAASDYDIIYRPGKAIGHADFLSRLPLEEPQAEEEYPDPAGIHLLEARDLDGLSAKQIAASTKEDAVLHRVLQWTREGWPESADEVPGNARNYYKKREELSIRQECLLWRDRVVIPSCLRPQVLSIIHATHQGETYSRAIARSIVWWPGIDVDVTDAVKVCAPCQQTASAPKRLVSPWPKAVTPWERIHFDYFGPFMNRNFLVIVDSFSHWPVVKVVTDLTAATLVTHTRYVFADFGKPYVVVTDNAAQFRSDEFEKFLSKNGVKHLCTPPWHPASNGLAERTVQTVKRLLSRFQSGDVHAKVARVLWAMRTTPSAGGRTPAEAMGRKFRTHLSQLHPDLQPVAEVSATPAPRRPGDLVWALHHRLRGAQWEPGVITAVHGSRCFDVRLETNQVLANISGDHLRPRFVLDQDDDNPEQAEEDVPVAIAVPQVQVTLPSVVEAAPPESATAAAQDLPSNHPETRPGTDSQEPEAHREEAPTASPPQISGEVADAVDNAAPNADRDSVQPEVSAGTSRLPDTTEEPQPVTPPPVSPSNSRGPTSDDPEMDTADRPARSSHQTPSSARNVRSTPSSEGTSSNPNLESVSGSRLSYGFTVADEQARADLAPDGQSWAPVPAPGRGRVPQKPARGRGLARPGSSQVVTGVLTRTGRLSRPPARLQNP